MVDAAANARPFEPTAEWVEAAKECQFPSATAAWEATVALARPAISPDRAEAAEFAGERLMFPPLPEAN